MKFNHFILNLLLIIIIIHKTNSQSLGIQETIKYINEKFYEDGKGRYYDEISLNSDGLLKIYNNYTKWTKKIYVNDVELGNILENNMFKIQCKSPKNKGSYFKTPKCIQIDNCPRDNMNPTDYVFVGINDIYNNKKLYNAFKYLFALINEKGTYFGNDIDPFSPNNFGTQKTVIINNSTNQNVQLTEVGGVYYLPVTIGNLTKDFILDSGASDVLISQEIEKKLIESKIITKSNYLSSSLYKIADGSIIECRRLLLPEIKIGNYIVKNVIASINSSGNTLLLGKSFLDKFQSWTIDNSKQILKLEK